MTDELYHHGIKGMRWGIRRYQNPDGSLTDSGKRRYSSLQRKVEKKKKRIASNEQRIYDLSKSPKATAHRAKQLAKRTKAENRLRNWQGRYDMAVANRAAGKTLTPKEEKAIAKTIKYRAQVDKLAKRISSIDVSVAKLTAKDAKYSTQIQRLEEKLRDLSVDGLRYED